MGKLHEVGAAARADGRGQRLGLAPHTFDVRNRVQRRGAAQRVAGLVFDTDDTSGVRIDDQAHGLARQLIRHLEALAQEGHRAVLPDEACDAVVEQRIEPCGLGPQSANPGQILLVARQRRDAAQAGVRAAVVDLLQPGPQPRVEFVQARDAPLVEFAEELISKCAMPALQLALALGCVGAAEDQLDAQARTDALQRVGAVRGAVVDDQLDGNAPAQQRLLEHAFDVQRRLPQAEGAVRDQTRGVVDERDEVGLAQGSLARHARAVHHVAVPDGAGKLGAEAALLFGHVARAGQARQVVLLKQPVHRRA